MNRPTPFFIFGSTATVIALMLGLLNTLSIGPAAVQAAASEAQAAGAPEVYQAPAQPSQSEQPTARPDPVPAQRQVQPAAPTSVPVVEPVFTAEPSSNTDLQAFIQRVADGRTGLAGVYATGQFAFPVARQPSGDPVWVSPNDDEVTLFNAPLEHGVTALLAHNNLAGRTFAALPDGQELVLVYGDGSTQAYRITAQHSFQSVEPLNTSGDLIDLSDGLRLTSGQVYERFYTGAYPLVLQTCIERNGDYFWGRLFLLAEPV